MRYSLESSGHIGPRLLLVWLLSFSIFIIGNYAFRLLGFIFAIKKTNYIYSTLLLLIIILTIIPTIFIQKGTSWNTIQFLYYALFLSNILLTGFLESIKKYKTILLIFIFSSDLIGLLGMVPNYLGSTPPATIPNSEIDALSFLKTQPKGVVLTVPYDKYLKSAFKTTPVPLYAYETTAYVSAYSHKQTFIDDEMNLDNSGYAYQQRLESSKKFFLQNNIYENRGFLLNNDISYIYIANRNKQNIIPFNPNIFVINIYNKNDVSIYKVLK
jgi:hypothetical protein